MLDNFNTALNTQKESENKAENPMKISFKIINKKDGNGNPDGEAKNKIKKNIFTMYEQKKQQKNIKLKFQLQQEIDKKNYGELKMPPVKNKMQVFKFKDSKLQKNKRIFHSLNNLNLKEDETINKNEDNSNNESQINNINNNEQFIKFFNVKKCPKENQVLYKKVIYSENNEPCFINVKKTVDIKLPKITFSNNELKKDSNNDLNKENQPDKVLFCQVDENNKKENIQKVVKLNYFPINLNKLVQESKEKNFEDNKVNEEESLKDDFKLLEVEEEEKSIKQNKKSSPSSHFEGATDSHLLENLNDKPYINSTLTNNNLNVSINGSFISDSQIAKLINNSINFFNQNKSHSPSSFTYSNLHSKGEAKKVVKSTQNKQNSMNYSNSSNPFSLSNQFDFFKQLNQLNSNFPNLNNLNFPIKHNPIFPVRESSHQNQSFTELNEFFNNTLKNDFLKSINQLKEFDLLGMRKKK